MSKIKFKIKTESNLMIGGNEGSFEIGGIDQQAVVRRVGDKELPYIPGSSFKGALRKVVRDYPCEKIRIMYKQHLNEGLEKHQRYIEKKQQELTGRDQSELEKEIKKFEKIVKAHIELGAECLFGLEGFNRSPRLLFSDLHLDERSIEKGSYFSIDAKNSIKDEQGKKLEANPRVYKVARKDLVFEGEINFQYFNQDFDETLIRAYIEQQLKQFNDGQYRLGNSKSRGYGKISIEIERCDS